MCTVVIRRGTGPAAVQLLAIRDEFLDRGTEPEAVWWPAVSTRVRGGLDRAAGGTAVAVDEEAQRVAVLVNASGQPAPERLAGRRPQTRGFLAVQAAAGRQPTPDDVAITPGFHLLTVEPSRSELFSWDGTRLLRRPLGDGDRVLTWAGLDQAQHARGRAVETALRDLPTDATLSPEDWSAVISAATVPLRTVAGRSYGTVSAVLAGWGATGLTRFVGTGQLEPSSWTQVSGAVPVGRP